MGFSRELKGRKNCWRVSICLLPGRGVPSWGCLGCVWGAVRGGTAESRAVPLRKKRGGRVGWGVGGLHLEQAPLRNRRRRMTTLRKFTPTFRDAFWDTLGALRGAITRTHYTFPTPIHHRNLRILYRGSSKLFNINLQLQMTNCVICSRKFYYL